MPAKTNSRVGSVKFSIFINKGANNSDPKLDCIIFHKIASIYRYLKLKDKLQSIFLIQNLKPPLNSVHTEDQKCSYVSLSPNPDPLVELNLPGNPH